MKTVRYLMEESGGNGIIRIDAGNGSAGPVWLDWEDCKDDIGHIAMTPVNGDETLNAIARDVLNQPDYDVTYASDWIVGDCWVRSLGRWVRPWLTAWEDNGQTDNPWRFRLVF